MIDISAGNFKSKRESIRTSADMKSRVLTARRLRIELAIVSPFAKAHLVDRPQRSEEQQKIGCEAKTYIAIYA